MNKQNLSELEKVALRKGSAREKKKRLKMRVDSAGTRRLARIIGGKSAVILVFFIIGIFSAIPALADEKITNYEVELNVNDDATTQVVEKITYDFGAAEKHGIYRDIIYRYEARGGHYSLKLTNFKVTDENGQPHPFTVSNKDRYREIRIGDPDKTVTGLVQYQISYEASGAVNFFPEHDELYWNAVGNEWEVPIEQAKTKVSLPANFKAAAVKTECLAGPASSGKNCLSSRYQYQGEDEVSGFIFVSDRLEPGSGMTVVIGWPKGGVSEPSFWEKVWSTVRSNWILSLPVFVAALFYYLWRFRGRDPEGKGTIVAQFDAPDNLTPTEVGTIIDEKAETADISAAIIHLAVRGYLKITRLESGGALKKADYVLKKLKAGDGLKNDFERQLFVALFPTGRDTVGLNDLKEKFYREAAKITKAVYQQVVVKGYFAKNPHTVRGVYTAFGVLAMLLSFFVAPIYGAYGVASVIACGVLVIIFAFFMPARTRQGVLAREYILGLKEYLSIAEKDRLKFHNAPAQNPEHFEKLLPYAMVLGVENEWANQFAGIYDREPAWYSGGGGNFSALSLAGGLKGFQANAGSSLTARPSAARGSSGFGGGHVGGGFGGGGGRSW